MDTKTKDLAFDERRKKEAPVKAPSADNAKPQGEEEHPQAEVPVPVQTQVSAAKQTEVKFDPVAADFQPGELSKDPNSFNSASAPSDPDWDFSDSQAHYSRGSRAPRGQRYVRVPRNRGDRKGPDTPVSVPDKPEEPEKPVEVPKTRKRAWTSEEDDKAVINHPPIQVETKVEVRVEEQQGRGRGWRGRGRPR